MVASGWIDEDGNARRALQDPRAGRRDLDLGGDLARARRAWAASTARTATSPSPTASAVADGARIEGVDAHAIDPDAAARLWTVSAELTGVDAFAAA